jgi:phospholipid/cholesterol/gamma-HCH transport system substrate-binding protein
LPATEEFIEELRPLLPEFDPVLRQLNPMLVYISAFKPEIASFFANSVAATQASNIPNYAPGQRVHYLRTSNPLNPENLAVYPSRIGSNRPNAYTFPLHSLKYAELLAGTGTPPVYESRHCGNGVPTIADTTVLDPLSGLPLVGEELSARIREFAYTTFSSGEVAAPPCVQQGKFSPQTTPPSAGETFFPQVAEAPSGSSK